MDLVTSTEEIPKGKLYFLCSGGLTCTKEWNYDLLLKFHLFNKRFTSPNVALVDPFPQKNIAVSR